MGAATLDGVGDFFADDLMSHRVHMTVSLDRDGKTVLDHLSEPVGHAQERKVLSLGELN